VECRLRAQDCAAPRPLPVPELRNPGARWSGIRRTGRLASRKHEIPGALAKGGLGSPHDEFRYSSAEHRVVSDLSDVIGIVVLFVSLGIGGLTLFLLRGKARLDTIRSAFAQVTVVPERRRRFLLFLWIEVACFLATGVLLGLSSLGVQLTADPDLLFAISFLAGMVTLGALAWVGLSPRSLTESEREAAEKDAPTILESLWMVPYRRLDGEPPKRRRP